MNRRAFLTALAISPVAAVVPAVAHRPTDLALAQGLRISTAPRVYIVGEQVSETTWSREQVRRIVEYETRAAVDRYRRNFA